MERGRRANAVTVALRATLALRNLLGALVGEVKIGEEEIVLIPRVFVRAVLAVAAVVCGAAGVVAAALRQRVEVRRVEADIMTLSEEVRFRLFCKRNSSSR